MTEKIKTRQRVIYFDCYSGISGDMTLGALLDSGLELERLQEALAELKLSGYKLDAEKIARGGIAGTRAIVRLKGRSPQKRHLPEIIGLIDKSALPAVVRKNSSAVFTRLAAAEAAVHGIPVEKVHFHEVGAVDAIVDIVGSVSALFLLEIDRIYCSPLPLGRGEVKSAHGRLPLPAPATLELLAERNVPIEGRNSDFELVTPTGAAIVTTLADAFGPLPAFNIETVGYGAGSIDPGYPNFLRLISGSLPISNPIYEEEVAVIETNIDDQNPEIFGHLMEKLFSTGALDVYYTPVQMKKNRPAVKLSVLAAPEKAGLLQEIIFYETSTLGFRLTTARKIMRPREVTSVETEWGPVRIKYSPMPDRDHPLHFAPEYEDCQKIAQKSGLPLKEIYRISECLFRNRL